MPWVWSLLTTGKTDNINPLAIGLLIGTVFLSALIGNHFYNEWLEDRAAVKITEAVIDKTEADKENEKQFKKEVKRDLEKVGTDDIFDLIN